MMINLRGTCAAGKTYVGRALAAKAVRTIEVEPGTEWARNKNHKTLLGYELPGGLVVLGRYKVGVTSGGMEGPPQAWIRGLVEAVGQHYPFVFFEGYQLGQVSWKWLDVFERMVGNQAACLPIHVLALDTPLEVCLKRLETRTPGKSTNREVQESMYHGLHGGTMKNLATRPDLCTVGWIDHTRALEEVEAVFRAGGWQG